ncbi:hypothetical protein ADL26_15375, partial [Thermoactinomyces vulgaris]
GLDGFADVLEGDAGVEEAFDDLEDDDVAEGVEAVGARARGAADGGFDEAGAGPVVELAVGDADDAAGGGAPPTADLVGGDGRAACGFTVGVHGFLPCCR